jgi:hypothetical protein
MVSLFVIIETPFESVHTAVILYYVILFSGTYYQVVLALW